MTRAIPFYDQLDSHQRLRQAHNQNIIRTMCIPEGELDVEFNNTTDQDPMVPINSIHRSPDMNPLYVTLSRENIDVFLRPNDEEIELVVPVGSISFTVDQVIELVNLQHGLRFHPSDLSVVVENFEAPEGESFLQEHHPCFTIENDRLVVKMGGKSVGWLGSVDFKVVYGQLGNGLIDLSAKMPRLEAIGKELLFNPGQNTPEALLAAINVRFGVNIQPNDIVMTEDLTFNRSEGDNLYKVHALQGGRCTGTGYARVIVRNTLLDC